MDCMPGATAQKKSPAAAGNTSPIVASSSDCATVALSALTESGAHRPAALSTLRPASVCADANSGAILRHAGSAHPSAPKTGNLQFKGRAMSVSGPCRSCGKCGQHKPPAGGAKSVRYGGWVCAGCKPTGGR
jgi:hypothetical protein